MLFFAWKANDAERSVRKQHNAERGQLMQEMYMEISEAEAFMNQDGASIFTFFLAFSSPCSAALVHHSLACVYDCTTPVPFA